MLFDTPGWSVKGGLAAGPSKSREKSNKRARPTGAADDGEAAVVEEAAARGGKAERAEKVSAQREDGERMSKKKKRKTAGQETAKGNPKSTTNTLLAKAVPSSAEPQLIIGSSASTIQEPPSLFSSLSGSRFRLLNETLYTSPGSAALSLMTSDPSSFSAYHQGFAKQTERWPVNPVDVLARKLRGQAGGGKAVVVADLGCGEAGLAKALTKGTTATAKGKAKDAGKGEPDFRVFSYDLCSDPAGWVVRAECSTHEQVPLPGSHEAEGAQMVDAVVCCLSLMGTDWVGMLLEARRILRLGGRLHVAEVTSRFTSLPSFLTFLSSSLGFTSVSVDSRTSTHFVLFEFTKSPLVDLNPKKPSSGMGPSLREEAERRKIVERGKDLLKPCIYKRR